MAFNKKPNLGASLCMFGCSNDETVTQITTTIPFNLTASLDNRSTDAEDAGILSGNWDEKSQLAAMDVSASGIDKGIFTFTSGTSFSGSISTKVKNNHEIAVFYPASAITPNSSDTLTQALNITGQTGTLAGISNYDYAWASCKVTTDEESGFADCKMTSLMAIGKFKFTTDGNTPLNQISHITVSALSGTLYSSATVKLKDGTFNNLTKGHITIKNPEGLSGTTYIAFFPSTVQLHFTLVTTNGNIYEASAPENITLEKGKIYTVAPLVCTPAIPAKVGDYYYSDGTFSTQANPDKTCIGIVYALEDKDGNINPSLSSSPFGRIVALSNIQSAVKWASKAYDIEDIENFPNVNGTQTTGCLPYYKGNSDSYFSDKEEDWIKGVTVDSHTGLITSWATEGVLSDFNGEANTLKSNNNPAASYCYQYSTSGKGAGEWYLPALGELALLWELQQTGIISKQTHDCFTDFDLRAYWSSSESSAQTAWYLNFFSGMVTANSKSSTYPIRPVAKF